MQSLLSRSSLAIKRRISQLPQAQCRNLHIYLVPKDSSQSTEISATLNENHDAVHRFTEDDSNTEALTFVEEPCGMTAEQGFGYLQVDFGERFGPDGRFEISRKLGYGRTSSVWLARDIFEDRFVAIKALVGHSTKICKSWMSCGYDVFPDPFRRRNDSPDAFQIPEVSKTHCLIESSRFVAPGLDESDGEHLCFVTDPLGPSVDEALPTINRKSRIPLIKKVLRDTLVGLMNLHSVGIAHTAIRKDNILIDLGSGSSAFDIESFIEKEPARRHPPERTWGGKYTRVAVSQPFPVPSVEDCMSRNFVVSDFSFGMFTVAQYVDQKISSFVMAPDTRAPEVLLEFPWDEKVDIWAFGCVAFEMISSQSLIRTIALGEIIPQELLLAQMLSLTDERLPADTILSSKTAMKYLDPYTGWLNDGTPIMELRFSKILKQIEALDKSEDLVGVEALLRKCIRLHPEDRVSAKDLLDDPWLNSES